MLSTMRELKIQSKEYKYKILHLFNTKNIFFLWKQYHFNIFLPTSILVYISLTFLILQFSFTDCQPLSSLIRPELQWFSVGFAFRSSMYFLLSKT